MLACLTCLRPILVFANSSDPRALRGATRELRDAEAFPAVAYSRCRVVCRPQTRSQLTRCVSAATTQGYEAGPLDLLLANCCTLAAEPNPRCQGVRLPRGKILECGVPGAMNSPWRLWPFARGVATVDCEGRTQTRPLLVGWSYSTTPGPPQATVRCPRDSGTATDGKRPSPRSIAQAS